MTINMMSGFCYVIKISDESVLVPNMKGKRCIQSLDGYEVKSMKHFMSDFNESQNL